MKTLVIEAEMEEVGESIIRKFLGCRKNLPRCIDIEGLIQNYLRLPMVEYAEFADKDFDEMGFLSDGEYPLRIIENGKIIERVYPKGTIVIDRYLLRDEQSGRRRFTLAHEASHEPLVDEETFEIVQRIAEEKKAVYNERLGKYEHLGTSPNILRGLIFCADCKRPLVRYKSVTNKGRNLSYVWICQTHSDNPESCPKKYFQEKALMDILWNTIRHEIGLASELSLSVKKAEKSKSATERENALNREETEVQRAYDKAKMLYEGLYANYVDKLLTEQEYTTMKAQYRAEMEQAKERISLIRRQRESLQTKTVKNPWLSSFAGFHGATELTEDIAHALIERVEINAENGVNITLRYQSEYRELLLAMTEETVI